MIFSICDLNISLYRLLFSTLFTADDELIWLKDIFDPLCTIYLGMYKAQLFTALVHLFQIQKLLPLLIDCFYLQTSINVINGNYEWNKQRRKFGPNHTEKHIATYFNDKYLQKDIYKDNIILNDITYYHCPDVTAMQLQITW